MSTCPIPCRESFVWLLLVLVPNIADARTVIRDCPHCPEIVLIPAGHFTMDSLGWEKSWAAHHGGSAGAVADEAPQHEVSVPSFALGRYPAWLLRSATHERNPDKERLHMLSSRGFRKERVVKSMISTGAALLLLASSGATIGAPGDTLYTHPGRLIDAADGAKLNIYCLGRGSPTVVFDAGHQDWAPAWAVVQPEVAKWTRACSYDRPGSGFSDAGPMPRTSVRIADELRSALHNAGIAGPYILVGHAFGAINMRAFAYRYMPDVAGLVLLDTDAGDMASPEMLTREHAVFTLQESELRACRDALAAGRPLSSTPPSVLQPGTICEQRFFRGFPDKAWSAELNASLLHAAQTRLALFDEVVSELHEMPGDETYLREHQISFGSRPIRVLTAASQYADDESTPTDVHLRHLKNAEQRAEAQARFLTLSSNSKQIFAYHSASAYIQFDQPELVVAAIREVYDESRQGDAR